MHNNICLLPRKPTGVKLGVSTNPTSSGNYTIKQSRNRSVPKVNALNALAERWFWRLVFLEKRRSLSATGSRVKNHQNQSCPVGRMSGSERRVNRTEVYFSYMSGGSFLAIYERDLQCLYKPKRRNVKQIVKQNPLWNNSETGTAVSTISTSTTLFSPALVKNLVGDVSNLQDFLSHSVDWLGTWHHSQSVRTQLLIKGGQIDPNLSNNRLWIGQIDMN